MPVHGPHEDINMLDRVCIPTAPRTPDEAERLDALERLGVLDTAPEPVFDDLAWSAARLCETPIALVSLLDAHRQWFKARCGLDVSETPREIAFCAHTILGDGLLEVPDALEDERFATNPLVLGAPGIRFYAGVPLSGPDGHRYGSLCVIDTRPRRLDALQREALARVAALVSLQLQQRRQLLRAQDREKALTHMLETMPDGVVCCDASGGINRFNQVARQWFGIEPDASPMVHWERDVGCFRPGGEEPMPAEELPLVRAWRGEHIRDAEMVIKARDQAARTVSCNAVSLTTRDGRPAGAVVVMHDVTTLKAANDRLLQSEERWRATLDSIGDAVLTTDNVGVVTFANPAAATLLGRAVEDAVGQPLAALSSQAQSGGLGVDDLVKLVLGAGSARMSGVVTELQRPDGTRAVVESSGALIRSVDGPVSGAVLVLRDVTQARELAERISHHESRDSLTGIHNRAEFERAFQQVLITPVGPKGHVLLYVDLDQFKVINDSCGHVAGDELLKHVARALRDNLRDSDLLARFGGDEFVCLLVECPLEPATRVAEQMRDAVARLAFDWLGRSFRISASIGMVSVNLHDSVARALSAADFACHLAKEKGGNRLYIHHATSADVIRRHDELDWIPKLQDALANDRFVLYAQEIVPVAAAGHASRHFEILVRLRDASGALVPPMTFIPVAERYGLMPAIDRWVLRSTLAQITQLHGGDPVRVSINLSGLTLGDDAFIGFVEDAFKRLGADYSRVCLEITETAAIANLANAEAFINWFRGQGGKFSLDDFGSGMSSFGYLKRLKVDYLKIDGAFVKNLTTDSVDEAMVKAIHHVGHVMGLQTVAEFVDSDLTLARLRHIGVDHAQGYGIHVPQPLSELLQDPAAHAPAPPVGPAVQRAAGR